ncbi:MAG: hypothetical protein E6Q06_02430 [Candidatus Moraniibacteriota bacterium]|nr:MAG: hypothetical protein E6Q06_02430 [Candidatus Moranbacteria bacterium]
MSWSEPANFDSAIALRDPGLVSDGMMKFEFSSCPEATHRLELVERFLHRRILRRVPVLYEIDPQHRRARHWRAVQLARRRIVLLGHW